MQIWRMKVDGSVAGTDHSDEIEENWFPHVSPNGAVDRVPDLREGRRRSPREQRRGAPGHGSAEEQESRCSGQAVRRARDDQCVVVVSRQSIPGVRELSVGSIMTRASIGLTALIEAIEMGTMHSAGVPGTNHDRGSDAGRTGPYRRDAIGDQAMIREAAIKMNRGAKVRRTTAQRTAQSDQPVVDRKIARKFDAVRWPRG